jgi:hypothetical protein
MSTKLVGAALAAFVILFVAGFLVHGVWLGETRIAKCEMQVSRSGRKRLCATSCGSF